MFIKNRNTEFEKEICSILAQLAHYIHPEIVQRIQRRNREEFDYFTELFSDVDKNLLEGFPWNMD